MRNLFLIRKKIGQFSKFDVCSSENEEKQILLNDSFQLKMESEFLIREVSENLL